MIRKTTTILRNTRLGPQSKKGTVNHMLQVTYCMKEMIDLENFSCLLKRHRGKFYKRIIAQFPCGPCHPRSNSGCTFDFAACHRVAASASEGRRCLPGLGGCPFAYGESGSGASCAGSCYCVAARASVGTGYCPAVYFGYNTIRPVVAVACRSPVAAASADSHRTSSAGADYPADHIASCCPVE